MPAAIAEIIAHAEQLLQVERFADYGPNGLQVPGGQNAGKLITGVSASAELFERARAAGGQLILVHHGLFWGSQPQVIDQLLKRRLQILFDGDIALAAYHLPLDAHPEIGNNALLARALGAEPTERFASHRGAQIGCIAEFAAPGITVAELAARARSVAGREALLFESGPAMVRRVAIVSGAGSDHLREAAAAGADAFITGEPAERVMSEAAEAQINFLAAGHYATETLGIRALGERLAERFAVAQEFIDVPNPI